MNKDEKPDKEMIHENPKFEIIRQVVIGCHISAIIWFIIAWILKLEWLLLIELMLITISIVMACYGYSQKGYKEWLEKRTGNYQD